MGADNSEKNGYIFNIDIWYEPNGFFVPCAKGDTKCVIRGFKVNGEVINKDENHSFLDCMLSQSF